MGPQGAHGVTPLSPRQGSRLLRAPMWRPHGYHVPPITCILQTRAEGTGEPEQQVTASCVGLTLAWNAGTQVFAPEMYSRRCLFVVLGLPGWRRQLPWPHFRFLPPVSVVQRILCVLPPPLPCLSRLFFCAVTLLVSSSLPPPTFWKSSRVFPLYIFLNRSFLSVKRTSRTGSPELSLSPAFPNRACVCACVRAVDAL